MKRLRTLTMLSLVIYLVNTIIATQPPPDESENKNIPPPAPPPPAPEKPEVTSIDIGERHRLRNTRNGIFLVNVEDTFVGRSLDLYGEWCQSEVVLFSKIVRPGDVVVDIGANIGAFSVPLAKMVGPKGALVAFEPQRQLYQLLSANVALNEFNNAFIYQKALGNVPGNIIVPKVNYSSTGNFGGISLLDESNWKGRGPYETVEKIRLDDMLPLLSSCPTFVKIDVEGMELDVLKGMSALIAKCSPVIHIENNCKKGSKDIIEFVNSVVGIREADGHKEPIYDMYWDVHPYFNPLNFFNNQHDVFTDSLLSMNLLCIPRSSRPDLIKMQESKNMVKVLPNERRYLLEDYVMSYKGEDVAIKQLGDMEKCIR
ncbi:hypothetical protein TrVE_jg131 [Triparma verrucosa]|uniref:Methyltransferase FkbM domain-containing protein n=1 Tax=Triparma verrucosa TaxID=1606542 RepID=A0A9W7FIP2_9STRA|nr:hypothetical protein TrVE_jg131 [Triparma verrucosa]